MYRECYSCDDVLLVPRYSDLSSRSECDVSFLNYSIPVIASCMDTVYSPEIDSLLTSNNIMVMVHRYFKNYKEQLEYAYQPQSSDYRFFAVGSIVKDSGRKWVDGLLENGIKHFVVDMAHGDSSACVNTVKYINKQIDDSGKIIAGNVATKSGFRRLEEAGSWAIRCGIGCGCFTPNTLVMTSEKVLVPIQYLNIGDMVYTHTGEVKKIIGVLSYETEEDIVVINNKIECTKNHEFYVLHKKYEKIINKENISKFAEWIQAKNLIDDYMLIKLDNKHISFNPIPIKSVNTKKYSGIVYDLTVEDNHSYNVFNILVHNSICSTRLNTGFGVPLLTTLEDCALVRDSAYIIADGGVKHPGDISKAIAFGADFIQTGRMFASTDLAPGNCYDKEKNIVCSYREINNKMKKTNNNGRKQFLVCNEDFVAYKQYRGMASAEARKGVLKDSSIEGVSGLVPYTGKTEDFVKNLKNNLRASLSYAGAKNWHQFRRNVKCIRISNASLAESQTHVEA